MGKCWHWTGWNDLSQVKVAGAIGERCLVVLSGALSWGLWLNKVLQNMSCMLRNGPDNWFKPKPNVPSRCLFVFFSHSCAPPHNGHSKHDIHCFDWRAESVSACAISLFIYCCTIYIIYIFGFCIFAQMSVAYAFCIVFALHSSRVFRHDRCVRRVGHAIELPHANGIWDLGFAMVNVVDYVRLVGMRVQYNQFACPSSHGASWCYEIYEHVDSSCARAKPQTMSNHPQGFNGL